DASLDGVRVDRVVQHLADAAAAIGEWRRVLRGGGRLVVFEPDLTTARIEGVDPNAARAVCRWRVGARPGARAVRELGAVVAAAGLGDVRVDPAVLDVGDLGRADGIMGIADWGGAAATAGALDAAAGARWRDDVLAAAGRGTLRYVCSYVRARARVS